MNCVHDNNINCWLLVEFFKMEIDNEGKRQAKTKALKCETNSNEMKISFCFAVYFFCFVLCKYVCECIVWTFGMSYVPYALAYMTAMQLLYFAIQSTFKIAIKAFVSY